VSGTNEILRDHRHGNGFGHETVPAQPPHLERSASRSRNPLALAAGREIAARSSASVPTNLTNVCALVNAVYNSSRVDKGESSSGRTNVTRSN
jgi:hypothetical protein